MGKFCILKFVENYEYLHNKSFALKNKKFRDIYIRKFNPFMIEDIIFGENLYMGISLFLPITYEDALVDQELLYILLDKTANFLISQDINIVLNDRVFLKSDKINYLENLDINLFFIKDIVTKVIKYNNFNRKDVSVGIIGGELEKTLIAINEIYDDLNFLSIINHDGQFIEYEEFIDDIFYDSGLLINFSKNCRDIDIIINLSNNPNFLINTIKNNAVVIDLQNTFDSQKITNKIIKNFKYKIKNEYLTDYQVELILYSTLLNFRKYKDYNNKINKFNSAKKDILGYSIKFNRWPLTELRHERQWGCKETRQNDFLYSLF